MSHLLDTHAFLWFINDDKSLSQAAKAVIEDPANTIYLSVASVWEMAIKVRLGKLEMPLPFLDFMTEQMRRNSRLRLLGINIEHADIVASLPLYHRDPFDRMIIAQSLLAEFSIITKDKAFDDYEVESYW